MKPETEEKVIEVLTAEIIDQLDDSVKNDVVMLTDRLGSGMLPLNPIVNRFQGLLKYEAIIYDPEKDDESYQEYKDAKADIRNFRATVKETKKTMKADIVLTGKALDNIENTFIDKATAIHDKLDLNFKVKLDEIEEKKIAAAAKKEKARTDEIAKLQKESADALLLAKKQSAFGKVKYDTILEFKNKKIQELENLNLESIIKGNTAFDTMNVGTFTKAQGISEDWELLEGEQQIELANLFKTTIKELKAAYDVKKAATEKANDEMVAKAAEELAKKNNEAREAQTENTASASFAPVTSSRSTSIAPAPPVERPFALTDYSTDFTIQKENLESVCTYFNSFLTTYKNIPTQTRMYIGSLTADIEAAVDDIEELIK